MGTLGPCFTTVLVAPSRDCHIGYVVPFIRQKRRSVLSLLVLLVTPPTVNLSVSLDVNSALLT